MIQLLWGLLNIGLSLFFLVICFKALRLIRDNIGYLASIVFVFGIVSPMGYENSKLNRKSSWEFAPKDSIITDQQSSVNISLEKALFLKVGLNIHYGYSKTDHQNTPIDASSILTGFTSGLNWKPTSISVYKTTDNLKFKYSVYGVLEWKLFGTTIYTQTKDFEDIILLQ